MLSAVPTSGPTDSASGGPPGLQTRSGSGRGLTTSPSSIPEGHRSGINGGKWNLYAATTFLLEHSHVAICVLEN